jgi:aminoglycoside phosphotransferase (APT) family kinase protein
VPEPEDLPVQALQAYIRERLPGMYADLEIERCTAGHSNLTYLLRAGGQEYVLRRPPLGPVAPKAHDMVREFAVLQAVSPHFPYAPHPWIVCDDADIIGAPFFIMERRKGQPLDPYADTTAVIPSFVDCLVKLHEIEPPENLGKPDGYLARQVTGWADRANRCELPSSDVPEWLANHLPASGPPSIIHNDYKFDNMLFEGNEVESILDWEMATVGDPLADVGIAINYAPSHREEILKRYINQTHRNLSQITWYEVYAAFRLAVIMQQIHIRYKKGQTKDPRFATLNQTAIDQLTKAKKLTTEN